MLFGRLILGLAVFGLTVSKPIVARKPAAPITLYQVQHPKPNNGFRPHPGYMAHAKALVKYGGSKTKTSVDKLLSLAQKHGRDSTSVTLTNVPDWTDSLWLCQLGVGNQTFWVDFDTGSSDFWLFGNKTQYLAPNQTKYEPGSTATKLPNETFYILYGDDSFASGPVYKDTVTVGSLKVPDQAVEVSNSGSGSYTAPMSGIVGLGFDSGNQVRPNPVSTIFTTMIASTLIPSNVFTADLRHQEAGCYTFGAVPSDQYSGNMVYSPSTTQGGWWTFHPTGQAVGDDASIDTHPAANGSLFGVVDTGTTLMLLDEGLAKGYYSHVKSARFSDEDFAFVFDCDEQLPSYRLQVGTGGESVTIRVPGEMLNFGSLASIEGYGDSSLCYGGIQTHDYTSPSIYGDMLLKNAIVVFDRGNGTNGTPRVGFAAKA